MAIEVFNRNECKFLLDKAMYEYMQEKLFEYMELDEYNQSHEFYTISNIYFDTKDNYLIRNSLSKPVYKEKLRLRAYGIPEADDIVFLEIKKKVKGLVNKRRTKLKLNEAYEFLSTGRLSEAKDYINRQVLNEIEYLLKMYNPEPKLYLAYDRKAMFGKENRDLRVTFDTNIRTRRYDLKLESGDYGDSLLEEDKWLMEVKTAKNLPIWMARLLSEAKAFKTSFSKYGREYKKMLLSNKQLKGEMNVCLKQYQTHYLAQPQLIQQ